MAPQAPAGIRRTGGPPRAEGIWAHQTQRPPGEALSRLSLTAIPSIPSALVSVYLRLWKLVGPAQNIQEQNQNSYENMGEGIPGWLSGLAPALAQGAILETQDRIPRRAPGAWSLLLPLPVSLPLSLSL